MSDRGFHRDEPERQPGREELATQIKLAAAALATMIETTPALEKLPDDDYREVDEAGIMAGYYLGVPEWQNESLECLRGHYLTIGMHYRTVRHLVRVVTAPSNV